MNYSVKIFSRIGELIQGFLPDRSAFLVSGLPSRIFFSEAVLEESSDSWALPSKARQALALFLETQTQPDPLRGRSIRLTSNIPPGKGLSSSSADVLSVLHVANDYLQAGLTHDDLYRFAARVEPTDPCLSEDIVLFHQHIGITDRSISLPPLTLLYFDAQPERQVNTLDLHRPIEATDFYTSLLRSFLHAAEDNDHAGLFDSITRSAVHNQKIITLPRFDEYFQLAKTEEAGLMVAHSGTIIGMLTLPEQAAQLLSRLEAMTKMTIYSEQYHSPLCQHPSAPSCL